MVTHTWGPGSDDNDGNTITAGGVFISVFILIAITLGLGGEENSVDTMECQDVR